MSRWHLERNGYITKNDLPEITRQRGSIQATSSVLLRANNIDNARNATFLDSSLNNFSIVKTGDCYQGSFSPYLPANTEYDPLLHGGSCYLDGNGDYLQTSSGTNLNLGTGDFTIEMWVYFDTLSNNPTLFDQRVSSGATAAPVALVGSLGEINTYRANGILIQQAPAGTVLIKQWTHIAWVRTSGVFNLYRNGVRVAGPTTLSYDFSAETPMFIGVGSSAQSPITGYLCDFRIVRGSAVYDSNFTTPTTPLTAITNTALLLNFTNAGIYDSCGKVNVLTDGDARISTSQSKFGVSSMYFDGTGDSIRFDNSPELNFGTGSFTVEFFMRTDSTQDPFSTMISRQTTAPGTGGSGNFGVSNFTSGGRLAWDITGQPGLVSTSVVNTGTWRHIALVRDASSAYLFVDGVLEASTNSWSAAAETTLQFGLVGRWQGNTLTDNNYRGWIDELRITKGAALYKSSFTPPAEPQSIGPFEIPTTVTNAIYGVKKLQPISETTPCIPILSPLGSSLPVGLVLDGLSVYLDTTIPASYPGSGNTWFDISGNNRDFTWDSVSFTAGSPSYFNTGSGRRCQGPASNSVGIDNTSGYTVFLVMLQNTLTSSSAFKFYRANASGNSGRGIFSHCTWSDGVIYFDQGGCCLSSQRTNVSAGTTNTWNIYTFRRLTNSSTRSILKNGTVLTTNTNSAANIDLDSRLIDLGRTDEDSLWNARLGGFLVYNRGLTDLEVGQVVTAIRGNFGI
jgi:hypothetical protein